MRDDFAKQLTERERHRHGDHYGNYRHLKIFKKGEDYWGGRESMKARYNIGYDRKSFNENLNPLKGWIHSCLGKNWDKCYSELRQNFDARKVVNAHILEHLYQYIEVNAKVIDGKVMVMNQYAFGTEDRWVPISRARADYYVCPKSGLVRKTNKAPRRSVIKEAEANKRKAELAVKRVLDEKNELHFIDGIWYHLTVETVPTSKMVYVKPLGATTFKTKTRYGKIVEKTWEELNEAEKMQFGTPKYSEPGVRDVLTGKLLHYSGPKKNMYSRGAPYDTVAPKYYATKATASHKLLKQAGIDGSATFVDGKCLSHREAAKYRPTK